MDKKFLKVLALIVAIIAIIGIIVFLAVNPAKNKKEYIIEKIAEEDYKYYALLADEKYGVIDTKGEIVVQNKYNNIIIPNPTKDVFIVTNEDGTSEVLNKDSENIFTQYKNVQAIEINSSVTNLPYEKSVLKCEKNNKYGLINLSGKKILNMDYDSIEGFSNIEGELKVEQNGKFGVVNIKGASLVKPEYDIINSDEYYDEEKKYQEAGYIVGQKNQDGYKYGYIDSKGKLNLKIEYNDITRITDKSYKDGIYLIAAKNGQYGVIKNSKNILQTE